VILKVEELAKEVDLGVLKPAHLLELRRQIEVQFNLPFIQAFSLELYLL